MVVVPVSVSTKLLLSSATLIGHRGETSIKLL
jgi:hypothetical protein